MLLLYLMCVIINMHMFSIKGVPLCVSQCYSKNKLIEINTKLKQTIHLTEFEPETKGLAYR